MIAGLEQAPLRAILEGIRTAPWSHPVPPRLRNAGPAMPKRAITVRLDEHDWQVMAAVAAEEGIEPTDWLAREARRAALAAQLRTWNRAEPLENQDWLEAAERESNELWAEDAKE